MMNILETQRLVLTELSESDAAFMLELLNSPAWLKYIGDRGVKTLEDAEQYILNRIIPSYQKNGFGFYLVKLKENNTSIGICGLVKREGLAHIDIGFAYLPGYEGMGHGYESASAVMEYAIEILKLDTIVAITTRDNIVSIRLLEKIGLRFKEMINLPGDSEMLMLFER